MNIGTMKKNGLFCMGQPTARELRRLEERLRKKGKQMTTRAVHVDMEKAMPNNLGEWIGG